jgi:hypothetical protein
VATNGHDAWTGKLAAPNAGGTDGPVATVQAAVEKARSARGASGERVSILLHNGIFTLREPLKLGAGDSGTANAPFTIAAAENAKPILSGGRRITGWSRSGGIRGNLWQANIPEVRRGDWYFRQLFINGQRAVRARTPNAGTFFKMQGARFVDKPVHFRFRNDDVKTAWTNQRDAEVIGLEKWTVFRQPISAVSTESNVVRLAGHAAPHTREAGAQYYVENTADSLDAPGEWHLDRTTGVLSYLAKPGEDLSRAQVFAPLLEELMVITGDAAAKKPVEHIVLRGLTFSHTDWTLGTNGYVDTQAAVGKRGTVRAEFAKNLSIEDCTFTHLAGYAVELGRGAQHCRVVGNEMTDLGAGGVRIGETAVRTEAFDAVHHHAVTDNDIHNVGVIFPPAVGVLILQSAHNRIAHNHIHDLFYTAVSVGWTWGYRDSPCHHNVIEFNHMHDIGKGLLSDMGAVYTLGPQPGTVVRNNLIHDVNASTYGGWGLYTDEGSTGIVMENNLVYRCKSAGFHQHYGKENVIRNNIFAFNKENQVMRTRDEAHLSFYFTNNVVLFDSGNLLGSSWKNDRFVIGNNLYWDTRAGTNATQLKFSGASWEQWRARGHDTNSVIADPLFSGAREGDFPLKANSPALKHGFKPIDLAGVGVRPKSRRK